MNYSVDTDPNATTITFQPNRIMLSMAIGGFLAGGFLLYMGIRNSFLLGIIVGCVLLLLFVHVAATILTGYNIVRLSAAGIAVK